MISIKIDGVEISTISPPAIDFSLDANSMRSVESAAKCRDFTLEVEVEASNTPALQLLSGKGYLHDGEPFNLSTHSAEILCEGEVILVGTANILAVKRMWHSSIYKLRIRQGGAAWATETLEQLIHEVPIEYSGRLSTKLIKDSWEGDSAIKFFPVHRDSYTPTFSSVSLDTVRRILSIDDYHPFINVHDLMMKMFEQKGYSVESEIMESELFKRLYISGAYHTQNSAEAKSKMDFYAIKMADKSAFANYMGRVYITPLYSSNSVGCLVDVASIDDLAECYSINGCLTSKYDVVTFTPTQGVSVGFEVSLHYTSDYFIKSRTALTAFDSLYLDGSILYDYGVANTFRDQRDEPLEMLFDYTVYIFDGNPAGRYQLSIMINGEETLLDSWTGIEGEVTTPRFDLTDNVSSPKLYSVSSTGARTLYMDDWALYMGYVETSGEVEVDVTIRTPPRSASPSSPIELRAPYISGATSGMKLTLKADTSLKPYFAKCPGYGSTVDYSELSQYEERAAKFMESVRHMFNLAIYSDLDAKKVYVESEEDIYNKSQVWDWSDRVIESEPIVYSDLAVEGARRRKWGYQDSDGVTTRMANYYYVPGETYPDTPTAEPEQNVAGASCPEYGSWIVPVNNYAAEDITKTVINPLFSPTINDTRGLPIVGDRDNPDMVDTLDFSPRVLSFEGMMYSGNELIPNTVFFSEDMGVSLCFEDRDGVTGLNKYYREAVKREERGQYVELSIRITPSELIALQTPITGRASMLSTFNLVISGEMCEARIERIEMKMDKENMAKCKFLIIK